MTQEFNELLNQIHIARSPEFLQKIPNESITLTLTSPPYYDDDLYIEEDGSGEFGWISYEDYLIHLDEVIAQLFRVTIPGGRMVLVLTNTPQIDDNKRVSHFWPLNADLVKLSLSNGFKLVDEIIWAKSEPSFPYISSGFIPEAQIINQHDTISVFRKPGPLRFSTTKRKEYTSIWELPAFGPIGEYNTTYPSFPDELVRRVIELWSLPHDVILDPYAGSGQVIKIGMDMDRFAIGVEADAGWQELWNFLSEEQN